MPATRPVALITGASSGLGATFARQLAIHGMDLILVARRRDRLEQLAKELESACGVRVEVLPADLTAADDLARVEQRIADSQDLEYLINNAGFGTRGKFFQVDRESQDQMHRLHVLATMRLVHAALPGMVARRRGSVINVSSVAAFASTPGNVSYCATKAWMNAFTVALAAELDLAGSPVRVQALCPGFTYTEFHDVMGMDRNLIPKGWWLHADAVVAASLRGARSGKLIVIPGLRYKLLVMLMRAVPHWLMRRSVRIYARRTKRL